MLYDPPLKPSTWLLWLGPFVLLLLGLWLLATLYRRRGGRATTQDSEQPLDRARIDALLAEDDAQARADKRAEWFDRD